MHSSSVSPTGEGELRADVGTRLFGSSRSEFEALQLGSDYPMRVSREEREISTTTTSVFSCIQSISFYNINYIEGYGIQYKTFS